MIFLTAFTGLEAYSISVITSFYDSRIVIQALVITLAMFGFLTLFALPKQIRFHRVAAVSVWCLVDAHHLRTHG